MSAKHLPRTSLSFNRASYRSPSRAARTQGVALVVVLLSAMVLMVSLLAISATMVVSSQRTTADQGVTLQAQYAAEAGLARVASGFTETQAVMQQLRISSGQTANNVNTHVDKFCDTGAANVPSNYDDYSNWSAEHRSGGFPLCTAINPGGGGNSRYSLFTAYISSNAYPDGAASPGQYWQQAFSSATGTGVETKIATDSATGAESWYRVKYGLKPEGVTLLAPNYYRFSFSVAATESVGEVKTGTRVIASRKITRGATSGFFIDVSLPSMATYALFSNKTESTSNTQLYFTGGETFDGPVHTNGRPGFLKVGAETPIFTDTFSSYASSGMYSGYSSTAVGSADYKSTFINHNAQFEATKIELPQNSHNQLRASFGGDSLNGNTVNSNELKNAWRFNDVTTASGVYYSKGDNLSRNAEANWADNDTGDGVTNKGGIYVRGSVDQLKFSTQSGRQVIEFRQGSTTTRFEKNADDTWTVKETGKPDKPLTGTFNGMIYVDGSIDDLSGDGSTDADIAQDSQLTLTSTGDMKIKQDITYAQDPRSTPSAINVLGLYASSGSILADGPQNKDLNIHATIMAAKEDKGFGTVDPNNSRGSVSGQRARINLLGGIVEDRSQTVNTTGGGGYVRNYAYDRRFRSGFRPPYFPTQQVWRTDTNSFDRQEGVWQTVAGN